MALLSTEALVLRGYKLGETSKVVVLMTREPWEGARGRPVLDALAEESDPVLGELEEHDVSCVEVHAHEFAVEAIDKRPSSIGVIR